MPFLMVNLDDATDCKKALKHLRRRVHRMEEAEGCEPKEGRGEEGRGEEGRGRRGPGHRGPGHRGPGRKHRPGGRGGGERGPRRGRGSEDEKTTLKQKLQRISRRGVWRFLSQIAELSDEPRSLAELDDAMDLPKNKMRSTKAIFAKLENRHDLRFLVVDEDGGEDESGNPRYVMPKRIRKQIQRLLKE